MGKLISLVVCLSFAGSASAATFETLPEMSSKRLEAVAEAAKELVKNKSVFGDCSFTRRYSFTRKLSESNEGTIKQLNIAKAGLWPDQDENAVPVTPGMKTKSVVVELLENTGRDEHEAEVDAAISELTSLIDKAVGDRSNPKVLLYTGNHGDEDGTWRVLDLLDFKNQEVLVIRFGYCGT